MIVVQLDAPDGMEIGDTLLRVTMNEAGGRELCSFDIDPVPHHRFIFYPALPEGFEDEARITLAWMAGGETVAEEEKPFRVERYDEPAGREGRVKLEIPNEDGAVMTGMPATAGVPFPRGALNNSDRLRLVDEDGDEVALQVKETAHWSKFGSVKWALCDFTVDLDGGARRLYLEYGPDINRNERRGITVEKTERFPRVDAGRLRIDSGLWFDFDGEGDYFKILDERALNGAFVEHSEGPIYRPDISDQYVVEERGPEKAVLRREGWYRDAESGREFCKYITRYIIHRDSPFVRIFHTWIYTGDDRHDRIRNMGWEFAPADGIRPGAFLTGFGDDAAWHGGERLLQWDYEHFTVSDGDEEIDFDGGRAPGVASAGSGEVEIYFGSKDFWQNYPSELEFRNGSFWFHNWPRRNRPAGHTFDKKWLARPASYAENLEAKSVESASAARYALEDPDELAFSEWVLNIIQHRYAHEGEVLDFRLPERFAEPPLSWERMMENTNAQGISRTEEMWIYVREADGADAESDVAVLRGVNNETLRAMVDPEWVARSDAFHGIHYQDRERFPEEERSYELAALSYDKLAERLGSYGMWIYGDLPAWNPNPGTRTPNLTRAFQKQHLGWPYSWIPFARSGDSRLLKIAQANTRQIIDAAYCHYVGGALEGERTPGYWGIGPVYWHSGTYIKGNFTTVESFLHAWYLTGYHRAADHLAFLQELYTTVPSYSDFRGRPVFFRYIHGRPAYNRGSNAELKTYVDLYKQTFDPWFLAGAHAISRGHMHGRTNEFRDGERYPEYLQGYIHRTNSPSPLAGGGPCYTVFTGRHLKWFPVALRALADADARPDPITNSFMVSPPFAEPHAIRVTVRKESAGEALPLRFRAWRGGWTQTPFDEDIEVEYSVTASDGAEVLAGIWDYGQRVIPMGVNAKDVEIPADAPPGNYEVELKFESNKHGGIALPITGRDVPEVVQRNPGAEMYRKEVAPMWFRVPEDVERFQIDFRRDLGGLTMVWDPDGRRVWNQGDHYPVPDEPDQPRMVTAEFEVPPEHAGRFWRITGRGRFRRGPEIPGVFSVEPRRWFDPHE